MRFASILGLVTTAALAASACNIENHEGTGFGNEGLCGSYCARLSACGASQAGDIEQCVDACEDRFEFAHDYQRELCECSEWSSCEDLEQGRCSSEDPEPDPEPVPVGGSTSVGGGTSSGNAGSSTGGSTTGTGSCGDGGAPSSGGASGGGGQGGEAPDLPPPTPCVRDCDCLLTEWCVDGYCSVDPG